MWIREVVLLVAAATVGQLMLLQLLWPSLLVSGRALVGEQLATREDEVDPIKYLGNYGYLTKDEANRQNSMDLATFEQAVREFQRFANITETGTVDAKTKELMSLDRCGNNDVDKAEALSGRNGTLEDPFAEEQPDELDEQQRQQDLEDQPPISELNSPQSLKAKVGHQNLTRLERAKRHLDRHKRYALSDYKWHRLTITYRTEEYSRNKRVKREDWDQTLEQAFGAWSAVVPFKFVRRSRGKVDIEVKFVRGQHEGCDQDLQEKSGVLAHAYPPGKTPISGDIHFNDFQKWTTEREKVEGLRRVLPVAIHEIGHSLGVKHSHIEEAVMYPFNRDHFQLAGDDRVAIRKHYAHLRRRVESGTDQQQHHHQQQSSRPPAIGCGGQSYARGPECGQFYDCTGARRLALLKYCPPGLFWRQSKLWCDWPHNVPECNNVGQEQENGVGETEGNYGKTSVENSPTPAPTDEAPTEEPAETVGPETSMPDESGTEPNTGEDSVSGGEDENEQEGELAPGELNTSANGRTKKARRVRKKTKKKTTAY